MLLIISFFSAEADLAQSSKEQLRAELGLESDRPVILFVGKFIRQKCVSDLIEAISLLKDTEHNPYLLLVGDGELRKKLELQVKALALDSVIFLRI